MFRSATYLGLLLLLCAPAQAQLMEVFIWKPLAGVANAGPDTVQNALKAKAIQEKHGAEVMVARDQMAMVHFALTYDSYEAMNKFYTGLNQDEANAAFWRDANANPKAEIMESYLLDVVAGGEGGGAVYEVFVWQPLPGGVSEMLEGAMGAMPIHEKAGASVTIAMDRLNRLHYVMQYEGWAQYSKFWDTPNPEFEAYMAERSKNPTAELVRTYRAGVVQ